MAAKEEEPTIKKEPMIVKAFDRKHGRLIKEGANSGEVEEFVILPGIQIKQMCKFGNDAIVVYVSDADIKKGGVVVFDPITKKLRQHIETLAAWSCACDKDCLVVGGYKNGTILFFQYFNNNFRMVRSSQLHGDRSFLWGIAVDVSMNMIVSVGDDKKAFISNLMGKTVSHNLPAIGRCVGLHKTFSVVFVGCENGSIFVIDLRGSISVLAHGGRAVACVETNEQTLITGGDDRNIIGWKINQIQSSITLTQNWSYKAGHWIPALHLYSSNVYVNVGDNKTLSLNIHTGALAKEYSNTDCSFGLVVIDREVSCRKVNQFMTARPTIQNDTMIVKANSWETEQLIKEDVNTGEHEKFVVLQGAKIYQMCKLGNDVIFVYQRKTDKTKGGVVVFDPITKKLKQHIETPAVYSCGCDNNSLVVGGWEDGMVYIFQYENSEFQANEPTRLHACTSIVYGVAIDTLMNTIVSVGNDKKAITSNLQGELIGQHDLPDRARCVAINNEFSLAFVGCEHGYIVVIDLRNSVVKATVKAHDGREVSCIATQDQAVISGGENRQIIKWKIEQRASVTSASYVRKLFVQATTTTFTVALIETWNYTCKHSATSLHLHFNHAFANVYDNGTIAINIDNGQLESQYSKTGLSYGIVVIVDAANKSATSQEVREKTADPPFSATTDPQSNTPLLSDAHDEVSQLQPLLTQSFSGFAASKNSLEDANSGSSNMKPIIEISNLPQAQIKPPSSSISLGEVTFADIEYERDIHGRLEIGRGAFAVVFKAKYKGASIKKLEGQFVAAKELQQQIVVLHNAANRLMNEAKLLLSLSHRNVCAVYGAWRQHDESLGIRPAIVMEFLPIRLDEVLDNPQKYDLDFAKRLSVARQIAEVIWFLRSRRPQVLHCDLKPQNIMMTIDLVPKLCDFGEAKERMTTIGMSLKQRSTMGPTVRGTSGYIAPEAYKGVFEFTDIFALGVITDEILSGNKPFSDAINDADVQNRVCRGERPSLDGIPQVYKPIIQECWHQDPRKRCDISKLVFSLSGHLDELQKARSDLSQAHRALNPAIEAAARSVIQAKFALVIGVRTYMPHTAEIGLDDFSNSTINDANEMSAALTALGFTVQTLLDDQATKYNISAKLTEMTQQAAQAFIDNPTRGEPVILVFFAGHGIQLVGEPFIVPFLEEDVDINSIYKASVKLSDIALLISDTRIPNVMRFIVTDCCRELLAVTDPNGCPVELPASAFIRPCFPAIRGTFFVHATSRGMQAFGTTSNGIFTGELMKVLRDENSVNLEHRAFFAQVHSSVDAALKPHSQTNPALEQIPENSDTTRGDFVFNPHPNIVKKCAELKGSMEAVMNYFEGHLTELLPVTSNTITVAAPRIIDISDAIATWTIEDVERWLALTKLNGEVVSKLNGFTGEELTMLCDGEAFDELKLTKLQSNRLKKVLAEIGIIVKPNS